MRGIQVFRKLFQYMRVHPLRILLFDYIVVHRVVIFESPSLCSGSLFTRGEEYKAVRLRAVQTQTTLCVNQETILKMKSFIKIRDYFDLSSLIRELIQLCMQ